LEGFGIVLALEIFSSAKYTCPRTEYIPVEQDTAAMI
jgi:hypothetical protein